MMKIDVASAVIVPLLALGFAIGQERETLPPYKPLRLQGRQFPVPEAVLLQIRDKPNDDGVNKMRAHAWDLFAGLTQENPIWESWYTKCDVRLAVEKCPKPSLEDKSNRHRLFRGFEIPVQSLLQLERLSAKEKLGHPPKSQHALAQLDSLAVVEFVRQFRERPQFASVLFNKEAADHILAHCLYRREVLKKLKSVGCPEIPTAQMEVAPFPREAVVLKTAWELVHQNTDKTAHFVGPLTTWNSTLWNVIQAVDTDPSIFSKKTMIDTRSSRRCEYRDYRDDESVPLSCFFYYQITKEDVESFPHVLDKVDDEGLVPGDYLILVAVHVATREIADWVWATFWWDNRAVSDPHAKGRPHRMKSRWKHFLMDTTLSDLTPSERDGGPKICFNPYLETAVTIRNGVISNCMQCHRRAVFSEPSKDLEGYDLGVGGRHGATPASGNPQNPNYFKDALQTDFMWSLASPQDKSLSDILDAIVSVDMTTVK